MDRLTFGSEHGLAFELEWSASTGTSAADRSAGKLVARDGVSEALYLNDPDENGVELYWDKPKEQWPFNEEGSLQMVSEPLDLKELLTELE